MADATTATAATAAGGRADSFKLMDEVSLKLPALSRGPQQPGRLRPRSGGDRGRHNLLCYLVGYAIGNARRSEPVVTQMHEGTVESLKTQNNMGQF